MPGDEYITSATPDTDHKAGAFNPRRALAVLGLAALVALAVTAVPATAHPARHSTSLVYTIPPPETPPRNVGSSTLVRTDNGLAVGLETSKLEPGDVVTLWWVVANKPEECEAGLGPLSQCGPMDHPEGRGDMAVHHAAGQIVDEDGTASFVAHLDVGDLSRALFNGEPGLTNPLGAEVLLVLKTHGQNIPELTAEMLGTFTGGCQIDDNVKKELEKLADRGVTPRPEVFGEEGPNTGCTEVQFSVHSPSTE